MSTITSDDGEEEIIFRRFITVKGKLYDAYDYGKKAWPIRVKPKRKRN